MALEKADYPEMDFELVFESDFHAGISGYLRGQEDKLLVMSRYNKPFFQTLIRKSHLQQTPYSKVPLLVVPADDSLGKQVLLDKIGSIIKINKALEKP